MNTEKEKFLVHSFARTRLPVGAMFWCECKNAERVEFPFWGATGFNYIEIAATERTHLSSPRRSDTFTV